MMSVIDPDAAKINRQLDRLVGTSTSELHGCAKW